MVGLYLYSVVVGLLLHLLIATTQLSELEGASTDAQSPSATLLSFFLSPTPPLSRVGHKKSGLSISPYLKWLDEAHIMRWTKWGFTANESFFLFFLPTIAGYQQLSYIKSLFPIPSQRKWIPEALQELKSSDGSNQLCLMVCTALLERNAQLCRRRQKPIKFFAAYFHLCSIRSTLHLKATTHLLWFHYCTIY